MSCCDLTAFHSVERLISQEQMPDVSREEYVPLLTVHKCTQRLRYRVHSVQTDTSCKNSRQPARKYVGINQKLTLISTHGVTRKTKTRISSSLRFKALFHFNDFPNE